MINTADILETIHMIREENLDIRTVTMGISLYDCVSDDIDRLCANVYDKIMSSAKNLVSCCEGIEKLYGIPIVNKRVSVTPISQIGGAATPEGYVRLAKTLDRAAHDLGINFIGGFSALVQKGMTKGADRLIDAIPEALAVTDMVCSSVNVGSTRAGINMDAVARMGRTVKAAAELTRDRDAIGCAKFVVFSNAVDDNPVVDPAAGTIYHGGNFHGDYVSLEMDKLKIAVTKMTMLAERQLNYLFHDRINETLPPFVNLGKLGLNYGLQAAQFTATSTTAESQTLSNPMYVHSIPNNNDNQDIVSMGTNAAMLTRQVVENGYQVAAIEMLALVQAADYLQCAGELSDATRQLYADIRGIVPRFADDTPKHREIAAIENFLKNNSASL